MLRRYLRAEDVVAPDGICRWCKKAVQRPRRNWCGKECVREYNIRSSGSVARHAVHERDHGVCQKCGTDTSKVEPRITDRGATEHVWEMDHIIPVVEGGGGCGLDNLRTLCIPCHRIVTRELRERLKHADSPR